MRIVLEHISKEVVIPVERPTVPIAEAVSKRHSVKGRPSTKLMVTPLVKKRKRYIKTSAEAFFIISLSILLLNTVTSSFLLKTDTDIARRTPIVVVFKPPAVEPVEPPISIRTIITAMLLSLIRNQLCIFIAFGT